MEDSEKIKSRFAEEVGALGVSKSAIADRIGFSSQTFTNVTSGRNMPGALLLSRIAEEFPGFDPNYVLTGRRIGDESMELKKLREELALKDSLLEITTRAVRDARLEMGKHKGVSFHPLADRPGFSELLNKSIMSGIIFGKRQN